MKTLQYLVRINRDPDSDWGASVPSSHRTFTFVGFAKTGFTFHDPVIVRSRLAGRHGIDFYATVEIAA